MKQRSDVDRRINECVDAIVRSIMSGNNSCGTFQAAVQSGGGDLSNYLARMVVPTIRILVEEVEQVRSDRLADISGRSEDQRVLEFIGQNLGGSVRISEPDIVRALELRLGRKLQ